MLFTCPRCGAQSYYPDDTTEPMECIQCGPDGQKRECVCCKHPVSVLVLTKVEPVPLCGFCHRNYFGYLEGKRGELRAL